MGIRLLRVKELPAANQHFTTFGPFKIGEVVEYRGELERTVKPESFRRQFINIFRMKNQKEMSLSREYFEKVGKWEYDK